MSELEKNYKAQIGDYKTFDEVWRILFGAKDEINNQEEALAKFAAIIPIDNFYKGNGEVFAELAKGEASELARVLTLWITDDDGKIKMNLFTNIPKIFKQQELKAMTPERNSINLPVIGRNKSSYSLISTTRDMKKIMKTKGFVNRYSTVKNLKLCQYAIRKSINGAFAIDFMTNKGIQKLAAITKTNEAIPRYMIYFTKKILGPNTNVENIISKTLENIRETIGCNQLTASN